MKLFMALVFLLCALPVASAGIDPGVIDPRPVCVFDPSMWDQAIGNVCADVDVSPTCVSVWGGVNSQHVYADVWTPYESVGTKPVNAGPVHVSPVSVTIDAVHVVTVDQWTPARGFTNDFCTTSLLA